MHISSSILYLIEIIKETGAWYCWPEQVHQANLRFIFILHQYKRITFHYAISKQVLSMYKSQERGLGRNRKCENSSGPESFQSDWYNNAWELLSRMTYLFVVFEEPPYVFHRGCNSVQSRQQDTRIPFSPHPLQHRSFAEFLTTIILTSVRWCLIVALVYISLMISDIDHLFICPYVFFRKMSFRTLCPFFKHTRCLLLLLLLSPGGTLCKTDAPNDPEIPLLDIYPEKIKH